MSGLSVTSDPAKNSPSQPYICSPLFAFRIKSQPLHSTPVRFTPPQASPQRPPTFFGVAGSGFDLGVLSIYRLEPRSMRRQGGEGRSPRSTTLPRGEFPFVDRAYPAGVHYVERCRRLEAHDRGLAGVAAQPLRWCLVPVMSGLSQRYTPACVQQSGASAILR